MTEDLKKRKIEVGLDLWSNYNRLFTGCFTPDALDKHDPKLKN